MTNAEIIQAIKAEIERQEKQCPLDTYEGRHRLFILGGLKTFLSTLEESEKPMNQDELEKEIEKYFPESAFNTGFNYDDIQEIARHFAQWGAENLKNRLWQNTLTQKN